MFGITGGEGRTVGWRLVVAGVILPILLGAPPESRAADVWVMDTPRGAQSIGVQPTIGPYPSAAACEEVNRRSFAGQGKCRLQSRTPEPTPTPQSPPPSPAVELRDAPSSELQGARQRADQLRREADRLAVQGAPRQAAEKYVEALRFDPDNAFARKGLRALLEDLVRQGKRREAADVYITLGQVLEREGRSADASKAYHLADDLRAADRMREEYYKAIDGGYLQDLADNIEKSGDARLKEEWQRFCRSNLPYTICNPKQKRPDEVSENQQQSEQRPAPRQDPPPGTTAHLRAEPSRADQVRKEADRLAVQGAPRQAVEKYVEALRLDPDNALARSGLRGLLEDLVRRGKRREAAEVYITLGQVLQRAGRSGEASKAFGLAHELAPDIETLQVPPAILPGEDFIESLGRDMDKRK